MSEYAVKKALAKGFSQRIGVEDNKIYETKVDKWRLLKAAEHRNRDLEKQRQDAEEEVAKRNDKAKSDGMKKFASMRGAKDDDFLGKVNGSEKQEGITFSTEGIPLAFKKV